MKGLGFLGAGLVTVSFLLFLVLPKSTNLRALVPVDEEDEWDKYSTEISALLPHAAQNARRSTPEELVASKTTTLQDRSEPQISVKSNSAQPHSENIDTGGSNVGVVKGTSRKLRKKYKLTTGGAVARVKRRPRGDHAGAKVGRGKKEKLPEIVPVLEEDPLTPSDKLLLEKDGVWEGIHPGVSVTYDAPVWEGEPEESPVISPGREDNRTFIFECDRSNPRSDVCIMRGNVQLYAASKTFQMFATGRKPPTGTLSVTPYARKATGEFAAGSTTSLELKSYGMKSDADVAVQLAKCNVNFSAPAVVFSIGGKTDNFFYALEDALVPLILTSFKYDREVVFVLLDWHEWWLESFRGVLRTVSKYPPILLGGPGEETERDREHDRVKALFGGGSTTGLTNGSEAGITERVKDKPGVSEGSDDIPGEDAPKAVFEKPADLLSLLTRRRRALGLEGLEEGLAGRKPGLENERRRARKPLQQWVLQEETEDREYNSLNGTAEAATTQVSPRGISSIWNVTPGVWESEPIPGAKRLRAEAAAEEWPELDRNDRNIYCFPEVVIGLTTHGNLRIDPDLPPFLDTTQFNDRWKALLHPGYRFSDETGALLPVRSNPRSHPKPRDFRNRLKLGLVLRNGPERRILNEGAFIYYAHAVGFEVVEVPEYASLEELFVFMQKLDVLVGVHDSLLANIMFMRKGSVLLQIAPFSTAWHADHHYGQGARARGLKYIEYEGSWWESSLSNRFDFENDVRKDPDAVYQEQGYEAWRDLYMGQSIWLEDSKAMTALRCAKRYLLESRKGAGVVQGTPIPEYVRGDFYFEW